MKTNPCRALKYLTDKYLCANIRSSSIPKNLHSGEFLEALTDTEIICNSDQINSIFLSISQGDSHLIQAAVASGYQFHYVQDDSLFLCKKLRPNNVPKFATHHIGAGGAVFSPDLQKILVIKGKDNSIFLSEVVISMILMLFNFIY